MKKHIILTTLAFLYSVYGWAFVPFETKSRPLIPLWVTFFMGTLLLTAVLLCIFVRIYKRRIKRGEALLKRENHKLNSLLEENKELIKRYLTVLNTTLVGLIYYDKNGILVDINDEMLRLFRLSDKKDMLEGGGISVYRNPLLRDYGIVDENKRIHEFHGIMKFDFRDKRYTDYFSIVQPKEEILYCKVDVIPVRESGGEMEGVLITAVDQTEEINHKQQLKEEEVKLNLAMEAGNLSAWIYDPQKQMFNTIRGNPIAGKGISLEDNLRILHPDDRDTQKEMLRSLLRGNKDAAAGIFRYLQEDGTYHDFEIRMIVKKEAGKRVSVLGTQKDITPEVQHNKILSDTVRQLRFAIHTANLALWIFDCKTGIFTSYNDPLADYKDGAPIPINMYDESFHKDGTDWERLKEATNIMKNGEDQSYIFSVRLQTKYDTEFQYCTIRGVPFEKDADGRVIKYLGIRVNITDQVKYQKILEQEKAEAQRADKLKSMFLANMSHEIRTPLNAIVGFSELLQTTDEPEQRAEFMAIINQNNELLLRLINDILDLSKIESGFIELKPELFDLSSVFNELYVTMLQRFNNSEIEFLGRNPYKRCKVCLDKNRLVQIGTNFITNAIKHTRKGHIRMGYQYENGGVKIYVEDTGCGIAPEQQTRLFQRFAKLDDFTQGTGLGLAICKALTEAQHGSIGVDSEVGKGSTFWAWIPCEAVIEEYEEEEGKEDAGTDASPVIGNELKDAAEQTGRKSILVAEDIDSNYLLIKAILRTCHLTRASTGKEAVELAATHTFDAILMDMKMPVMGGVEATRRIREFDKDVLIIAVTANAFDSDRTEALAAGCNAFVAKPVKKRELEDLLK